MQLFSLKVLGRSVAISMATISTALSAAVMGDQTTAHRTFQLVLLDKRLAAHNRGGAPVRPAARHARHASQHRTWGSTAAWTAANAHWGRRGSVRLVMTQELRPTHLLQRVLVAELRLFVQHAVLVVLERNLGKVLLCRACIASSHV